MGRPARARIPLPPRVFLITAQREMAKKASASKLRTASCLQFARSERLQKHYEFGFVTVDRLFRL